MAKATLTLSEMLDRTNPRDRDLTPAELASLEALIDTAGIEAVIQACLLYTSPSPRD